MQTQTVVTVENYSILVQWHAGNITVEFAYVAIKTRDTDNNSTVKYYSSKRLNSVGNITGTTSATSYNSGSDYRLKQDDTPLIDGIEKIKTIKTNTGLNGKMIKTKFVMVSLPMR